MAKTGLIDRLDKQLFDERTGKSKVAAWRGAAALKDTQEQLRKSLAEIGKTGDPDTILSAERSILINDLEHYGNSPAMRGSLQGALNEHKAALRLLARVREPDRYREIDETHSLPKNRVGGVPRDEARQFFRSHSARLLNMDKSRLDKVEKTIIEERRGNLRIAEKGYTALQRKALGLGPERDRDMDRGMGL